MWYAFCCYILVVIEESELKTEKEEVAKLRMENTSLEEEITTLKEGKDRALTRIARNGQSIRDSKRTIRDLQGKFTEKEEEMKNLKENHKKNLEKEKNRIIELESDLKLSKEKSQASENKVATPQLRSILPRARPNSPPLPSPVNHPSQRIKRENRRIRKALGKLNVEKLKSDERLKAALQHMARSIKLKREGKSFSF